MSGSRMLGRVAPLAESTSAGSYVLFFWRVSAHVLEKKTPGRDMMVTADALPIRLCWLWCEPVSVMSWAEVG